MSEPPTIAVKPRRPTWLLVVMIVLSLGFLALFGFSLMAAMMSPMVFDSGETPKLWRAFFMFLAFPVLILFSAALSWLGYGLRRYALIAIGVALPIIYMTVFWFSFS